MPWAERFKPEDWSEVVGNERTIEQFLRWLRDWKPDQPKKAALLHGPPGTGKTVVAEIAAKKLGFNLIELNASDVRTRELLAEKVYPASRSMSLYDQKNLILLDEIDGLHHRQDFGGASAVLTLMEDTSTPVVLTANDPWRQSLREIRLRSQMFEFKRLRKDSVLKRLRWFIESQGLTVSERALDLIAEKSRGDIRSALNDLEALAYEGTALDEQTVSRVLQDRSQEEGIFEALRNAMRSRYVYEARQHLSNTGLMPNELIDWVYGNFENLASDAKTAEILARATADSDYLSALMRKERVWMLIPYIYEMLAIGLMTCGRSGPSWVRLQMPSRVSQRWARVTRARAEAAEAKEIGMQLHERRSVVRSQVLPLLDRLMGKRALGESGVGKHSGSGKARGKSARSKAGGS